MDNKSTEKWRKTQYRSLEISHRLRWTEDQPINHVWIPLKELLQKDNKLNQPKNAFRLLIKNIYIVSNMENDSAKSIQANKT